MELPTNAALLVVDIQIAINRPEKGPATIRRPTRTWRGC